MKKIFTKLHLWLSIPFGILISILCLSGALLVFESEIQRFCFPEKYYATEVKDSPIPLDEIVASVKATLPDSAGIGSIQISPDPKRNYTVNVTGQGKKMLMVDPYTGEVKASITPYSNDNITFFSFIRRLHRWFMLENSREGISWGRLATGTTTIIFVFVLISGIIIWIPKTVKSLKRRLKIKVGAGWFRFWYDLHLAGGIYAVLLLLVMALTGLTWSFNWYRDGFYKVFGVEIAQNTGHGQAQPQQPSVGENEKPVRSERSERQNQEGERVARPEGSERSSNRGGGQNRTIDYSKWSYVVENMKAAQPEFRSMSIQNGSISVSTNQYGNMRASDRYQFDASTGEITGAQYYKDSEKSAKMRGWIYSVHVGSWGGMFTRILSFIACLIGASLPMTGYYFYLKKRSKKIKRRRHKPQSEKMNMTEESIPAIQ